MVTVRPEFDVQGDVPDEGWHPATSFGLTDVQVSRDGTTLDFFWDTDTDLDDLERQVALRFTPSDGAATGDPFSSIDFRVDNNQPPIVQLFNDAVISNPDERRGIPVPFRVIDEEVDRVEVIFQWRREGEEFPELPSRHSCWATPRPRTVPPPSPRQTSTGTATRTSSRPISRAGCEPPGRAAEGHLLRTARLRATALEAVRRRAPRAHLR